MDQKIFNSTGKNILIKEESENELRSSFQSKERISSAAKDVNLGFGERAFSAAGAAVLSAVIVNPLDVAKTRLQAQAAGVPYHGLCRTTYFETNTLRFQNATLARLLDHIALLVLNQHVLQITRGTKEHLMSSTKLRTRKGLQDWRGTYASLALAVPTVGIYLPCYDIFRNFLDEFTSRNAPSMTPYVPLVAGSVARSLACITFYPVELARTRMQAFKETQIGVKPPGVLKTLVGVISPVRSTNNLQTSVLLGLAIFGEVPVSTRHWYGCGIRTRFAHRIQIRLGEEEETRKEKKEERNLSLFPNEIAPWPFSSSSPTRSRIWSV